MQEQSLHSQLLSNFPGLADSVFSITSPESDSYNCIAWAAGDTDNWWWPSGLNYWPLEVPATDDVDSIVSAFVSLRYELCDSGDLQDGFEKVAIYARDNSVTHTARQLPSGNWTSKLGRSVDIEHEAVEALEGSNYGSVVQFMRRSLAP